MSLRCRIGIHKPKSGTMEMETKLGMGFFGGPVTTFRWVCVRCGKRCVS